MWEDLFKESLASQIKQRLQHEFIEKLQAFPGEFDFFSSPV